MIYTLTHSIPSIVSIACLLGIGLAMDCFGVSITNGFREPNIKIRKVLITALFFAFFQGLMPLIGWSIVFGLDSINQFNYIFSQIVPPLALVILGYLGIKMILEKKDESTENENIDQKSEKSFIFILIFQSIATSIDALSSGLAFNDYSFVEAIISITIIMVLTFVLSILGIYLGKKFGNKIGDKAQIVGGVILIIVGILIFVRGEISVNAPYLIPECLEWFF